MSMCVVLESIEGTNILGAGEWLLRSSQTAQPRIDSGEQGRGPLMASSFRPRDAGGELVTFNKGT
jgi:hypothetical protein